jgi:hypothetical protein
MASMLLSYVGTSTILSYARSNDLTPLKSGFGAMLFGMGECFSPMLPWFKAPLDRGGHDTGPER